MSRIIFRKAYIIVLPSSETTAVHGHPFLHLFCSADGCSIHVAQQRLLPIIFPEVLSWNICSRPLRCWTIMLPPSRRWYELEAFILDMAYLKKLQRMHPDCRGAFCGDGVAVEVFQHPVVDWNGNSTYIQSRGITQDFGVYASPDALLKEHHQEQSPVKRFLFRHLGRRLMNGNVRRIRACGLPD